MHRDGREIPVSQVILGHRSESGELVYFSTIMRDISDLKEAERSVRRLNAELENRVRERTLALESANRELAASRDVAVGYARSKSAFLANMSHEIRTPLNGIIGLSAMLADSRLSQDQRRLLDLLRRSSEGLLEIINNILDFSKIEAGRLTLDTRPFDPGGLIQGLAEIFSVRAREKGLEIAAEPAPGLPARLKGDPGRLNQILSNLAVNAVKFTDRGRVVIRAAKESESAGQVEVRFEVSDTGIGVPPGKLAEIFHPFTQADPSTTRRYGGTGLGLAISKQLVELMKGNIGAESRPGEGATFWCRIPFEGPLPPPPPSNSPERSDAPRPVPAGAPPRHHRRPAALLAEDNPINQMVTRRQLENLGAEVVVASNGIEALEAMEAFPYDVVFMDCQMPLMDGYQAAGEIRRRYPGRRIPLVALTAHALEGDREKCLAAGMDDHLTKPLLQEDLAAVPGKWDRPVDLTALRERAAEGGPSKNTVARFLKETSEGISRAKTALESGRGPDVLTAAEALRRAADGLGAPCLANLARRLEIAVSSNDPAAEEVLDLLGEEYQRVRKFLEREGPAQPQ